MAAIPNEAVVTATMGQLGWDLSDVQAIAMCTDTPGRCEIIDESYHDIYCLREGRNSLAFIDFKSAVVLEAAGRRVQQAHIRHPNALRMCWAAKKQEDWELVPNRWVRKSETWLTLEYADAATPLDITTDPRRKLLQVKRPGETEWQSMGAPGEQRLVWFAKANQYLTDTQREAGAAFVTGR